MMPYIFLFKKNYYSSVAQQGLAVSVLGFDLTKTTNVQSLKNKFKFVIRTIVKLNRE